jgi:hypothetical protein
VRDVLLPYDVPGPALVFYLYNTMFEYIKTARPKIHRKRVPLTSNRASFVPAPRQHQMAAGRNASCCLPPPPSGASAAGQRRSPAKSPAPGCVAATGSVGARTAVPGCRTGLSLHVEAHTPSPRALRAAAAGSSASGRHGPYWWFCASSFCPAEGCCRGSPLRRTPACL